MASLEPDDNEYSTTPRGGSHYQPRPRTAVVILVLFLAAVITFSTVTTSTPTPGAADTTTTVTSGVTTTTVPRSMVRVQVANGTAVSGLARQYTQQLMTLGWNTLPELNAAKVASTIIYYNAGFEWAARDIAASLRVSLGSLIPLGAQTPVAGASGDSVVIILGPELVRG